MAYGTVDRRIWNDEKFRRWPRDVRELWLYLLTCPHGNRIGTFVLDPYYAAADTQLEPDAVRSALHVLEREDRIVWDESRRVVCLKRHLQYESLRNPNVVTAAVGDLEELPTSPACFRALLAACKECGQPHYRPLLQALENRIGNSSPNSSGNSSPNSCPNRYPNPEPEPEPEPENSDDAARAREGVPRLDELRDWLGDYAGAAEAMADSADHGPQWARAVWGQFGPSGTEWHLLAGLDPPGPQRALAAALLSYAGEGRRYRANFFRSFVERCAGQQAAGTDPIASVELSESDRKMIDYRQRLERVPLEVVP